MTAPTNTSAAPRVTDAMIDAAARFFPYNSRDLARAALDAAMAAQPAQRECRHCGFLCSPNPAPSKAWHPLEQPAAAAAQAAPAAQPDMSERAAETITRLSDVLEQIAEFAHDASAAAGDALDEVRKMALKARREVQQ